MRSVEGYSSIGTHPTSLYANGSIHTLVFKNADISRFYPKVLKLDQTPTPLLNSRMMSAMSRVKVRKNVSDLLFEKPKYRARRMY